MNNNTDWERIAEQEPLTFISHRDNTPQPFALALPIDSNGQKLDEVSGLVIYLHGHSSDWRQGFYTTTYGGCFGRLHDELQKLQLAYATLDYRGTTSWMSPAAEADVTQLIEMLAAQLGTSKVYLIGGSMGGSSTLAYAVRHPELLSGVIALCPATDIGDFHTRCRTREEAVCGQIADAIETAYEATPTNAAALFNSRSALKNSEKLSMPVVLVHGATDALIPVSYSRELYAKLQANNARILYDEITDGDHDAPVVQAEWAKYFDFLES